MITNLFAHGLGLFAAAPGHDADAAHTAGPLTPWEIAAEDLLFFIVDIGIVTLAIGFCMCLLRLVKGPTLADRGLASDTLAMQVVGIAILLTIRMRTLVFFDAALIISILGFASTLAISQYIARRRSA